ncbi:DUF6538 domain-containing protein [Roseibium sp.]|uniref:DUF6538 domain-containing protein n=1 Tax=Roseibium sp. TaxID=1936156 RepID=UPI003A96ED94
MKKLTLRGKNYSYQRAVPTDLQERLGKRKWSIALKTDSLKIATIAAQRWDSHFDEEIARLRSIDREDLMNAEVALASLGVALPPKPLFTADGNAEAREEVETALEDFEADTHDERAESRSEFLKMARRGLAEIIPDQRARKRKARELFDGPLKKMADDEISIQRNRYKTALEQVSAVAPVEAPIDNKRLRAALESDLFDAWVQTRQPTEQTKGDTELATRQLLEFSGKYDLAQVAKEDVTGWVKALYQLPKRLKRGDKDLVFPQIIKRYEGRDIVRVSSKTVQKRFNLAQAIYSNAVRSGLLEFSPFDGIRTPSTKPTVDRMSFSVPQIRRIFATEPLASGPRDGFFWCFALALSSGMRLGEICLLKPSDIATLNGISFIDLTGYKLKTNSSRRRVPIHQDLIDAGFLSWAEKQPKDNLMGFKADSKGSTSGLASKKFNRWLSETVGLDERELVFHSFRHTFKDLCREAGIASDVHDRLTEVVPVFRTGQRLI